MKAEASMGGNGSVTDPEPLNEQLQKVADFLATLSPEEVEIPANELADRLNSPDEKIEARVISLDGQAIKRQLLAEGDCWSNLIIASLDTKGGQLRKNAIRFLAYLDLGSLPVDQQKLGKDFFQLFQDLITGGVLTEEALDPIRKLSKRKQSWSEANLGEPISAREIQLARREA